jgi:D-alanyl-D-alanine dipeptidase
MGSGARATIGAVCCVLAFACAGTASRERLPAGFVDVGRIVPDIAVDLRYFSSDNFVGRRIDGYEARRLVLTEPAAAALAAVQAELRPFGLGLLVYDGYRPERAVRHFLRWAEDPDDTQMKARYYPDVAKQDLLREGYVAGRSSHSRGSTLDLTLVARDGDAVRPLDMGTGWDRFSPRSWPTSPEVPPAARANRLLLRSLMTKHGFRPYPREWWHFTLADEPYPDRYFDFPIR